MDIARYAIKEPNVGIEIKLNKYFGIYCQGGYDIHFYPPGTTVSVPLSPSQWDFPILVYHGPIIRYGLFFNYDYNSKKGHSKSFYIKAGMTNKYLSYKDIKTYDIESDQKYDYTRDEQANVYGFDLLIGNKTYLFESKSFYFGWHLGFGHRRKIRDFVCYEGYRQGIYHQVQYYGVFITGISIGYQIKFKSDKNKP